MRRIRNQTNEFSFEKSPEKTAGKTKRNRDKTAYYLDMGSRLQLSVFADYFRMFEYYKNDRFNRFMSDYRDKNNNN